MWEKSSIFAGQSPYDEALKKMSVSCADNELLVSALYEKFVSIIEKGINCLMSII